jgi:hypothetical protein
MIRLTPFKNTTILAVLIVQMLGCLGISPQARAVCQQGCSENNTFNTFLGEDALLNNSSIANTAVGYEALLNNTNGNFNTAVGMQALLNNTIGGINAAIGTFALYKNTDGIGNTAIGYGALFGNTTAFSNTAIGAGALENNSTGSDNIAVGAEAGFKCTTGSNNIYIGNRGFTANVGESRTIRIGEQQARTFVSGISGVTVAGGVGVIVDTNGQLGTVVSTERFKDGIKPMDKASEAILALKPVTFRYKHELDPKGIPQFGLVAEDVEKVNPDLVARDKQGQPYTVRYEAVNAMLLNEFLKAHRKIQELEANNAQQQRNFAEQQKQIDALTAGLRKVSAQLELNKSAPQTVLNNR